MALLTGPDLFSEPDNEFVPHHNLTEKNAKLSINKRMYPCKFIIFIIYDALWFFAGWMGSRGARRQPVQNKNQPQSLPSSLSLCYRTAMPHGMPHLPSPCTFPVGIHWSTTSFLSGLHSQCRLEDPDTGGQAGQDHVCVTELRTPGFKAPSHVVVFFFLRGKKEYARHMGLLALLHLKGLVNLGNCSKLGQKTNCFKIPRYTIHHEQGLCHHWQLMDLNHPMGRRTAFHF